MFDTTLHKLSLREFILKNTLAMKKLLFYGKLGVKFMQKMSVTKTRILTFA